MRDDEDENKALEERAEEAKEAAAQEAAEPKPKSDLPDFRSMTTTDELVAAHAAMADVARGLGLQVETETNFVAVETGVKACERLAEKIEKARPKDEGDSTTESDVSTKTKKTRKAKTAKAPKEPKAVKAKKAKAPKAAKEKRANGSVRAGSKMEGIKKLLTRASGCTGADVRELTGWPAVSMPAMAKACGLKLHKEKVEGKPTRYYGK